MTNNLTSRFDESWSQFYQLLRSRKWISIYYYGKKYYFFLWRGRLMYLEEYQIAFLISIFFYFGTIAVRRFLQEIQAKQKLNKFLSKINQRILKKLLQKLSKFTGISKKNRDKIRKLFRDKIFRVRGGGTSKAASTELAEIIEDGKILRYETPFPTPDGLNYYIYPYTSTSLTEYQKYIKQIVKKCLKPGHFYKIMDPMLAKTINKIMKFKEVEKLRAITYEAFVFALAVTFKPQNLILNEGIGTLIGTLVGPTGLQYLPFISAGILGLVFGLVVPMGQGIVPILNQLFAMAASFVSVYKGASMIRELSFIECESYVKELPQVDKTAAFSISSGEYAKIIDPIDSSSSNSKDRISYTREQPSKHDVFISTDPGSKLYYQEDFYQHSESDQKSVVPFTEINGQVKTTDDIRVMNDSENIESASTIVKNIMRDQINQALLEKVLEGE